MSGIDLWNQLVERDPGMRTRIVFITGDVGSERTAEFLQRTGAPVLRKPFEIGALRRFVRKVLDTHVNQYPSEQ